MNIKELRTACGMTQQQFAETLCIPKRTIENWEGGKNQCPVYVNTLIEYYLIHEGFLTKEV